MPLDQPLFNRIVNFLTLHMKASDREAFLAQAFYGTPLAHMNIDGDNHVFATRLVSKADNFGRMESGNREKAIAHFLRVWMTQYGSDVQAQALALIDEIEAAAAVSPAVVSSQPVVIPSSAPPIASSVPSDGRGEKPGLLVQLLRKMPLFRKWPVEQLEILAKLLVGLIAVVSAILGFFTLNFWLPQSNSLCGHPNFVVCGFYGPPVPKASDTIVVVAGFGLQMADGTIVRHERADEVSLAVAKELDGALSFEDRVISLEDGLFGDYALRSLEGKHIDPYIIADTEAARAEKASQLATLVHADMVVYGVVRDDNGTRRYMPEFYVADLQTATSDVLQFKELGLLNREIVVSSSQANSIQTGDLATRLNLIHSFVLAMAQYVPNGYANAVAHFESAIQYAPKDPDMALLYVLMGNASGRALAETGNRVTQDQLVTILSYYKESLALQPNYTRGLIGTGDTLTALSGLQGPFQYDADVAPGAAVSCLNYTLTEIIDSAQLLAMVALDCYEMARNLTSGMASVDSQAEYMRASAGAGTVYMMLSDSSTALDTYAEGIEVYKLYGSEFDVQSQFSAGHLYARYARSQLLMPQASLTCDVRRDIAENFMRGFDLLETYGSYQTAAESNCTALKADPACGDVSNLCSFRP